VSNAEGLRQIDASSDYFMSARLSHKKSNMKIPFLIWSKINLATSEREREGRFFKQARSKFRSTHGYTDMIETERPVHVEFSQLSYKIWVQIS